MRYLATFMVFTFVIGVSAPARAQDEHRQILRDKFQNGLEEIVEADEGVAGIHIIALTDGSRFAVSDDLVFPQASAIKVPILLELFRRAEAEPALGQERGSPVHVPTLKISAYRTCDRVVITPWEGI